MVLHRPVELAGILGNWLATGIRSTIHSPFLRLYWSPI